MRIIASFFAALILLVANANTSVVAECRNLTIIYPYGPATAGASVMRLIAEQLKERIGVTAILMDHRPGAMGVPSALALKAAPADGCTVGVLAGIHSSSPWLMEKPSYDPTKEYVPITLIAQFPNIIVTADPRMRTFGDFLRIARAEPKSVSVGTMSRGSPDFLTGLFLLDAGVPVNLAPYHPRSEATQMPIDVLNGTLHVGIQNYFVFSGVLQRGGVWAIAVTTKERLAKLPDVPTVFEAGLPNFTETKSWFGLFGPPGLSAEVVTRLNAEIGAILREPAFAKKIGEFGIQAMPTTPQDLGRMMATEYRQQGEAIERSRTMAQ